MAFVVDCTRRPAGTRADIATSSALWFRELATTERRRLLRRSSDSSWRSSAASKLPARRMALISRANFLRSLSGRGSAHGASGAQCRSRPGACLCKDGPDLLGKSLKAIRYHRQDSVSRNRRQSLSRSTTRRGERIEDADRVKDLPVLQVLG